MTFDLSALTAEAIISGLHLAFPFLVVLFVYLTWRLLTGLVDWLIWKNNSSLHIVKIITEFTALFIIIFILSLFIIISSISLVNIQADPILLHYNNQLLMNWDRQLFGSYVPFWLQSTTNIWKTTFDALTPWLINTYKGLSAMLSLTLLIVLAYNYRHFYRMILTIVLTVMISVPMWLYLPALTPREAFFDNILKLQPPASIQVAVEQYQPNGALKKYFGYINDIKQDNPTVHKVVTTIPSLHVAWGTVIVYFAISAWPILAVFAVPYWLFNILSTMITLQHYAVDAVAGVIVGVLAIFITHLLIKKSDQESDKDNTINQIIYNDVQLIKRAWEKIRRYLTETVFRP